jgi:hypothetical protein
MKLNQKYLERGAIAFMVVGILCLCQPWVGVLHAWSVLIMIIGLIGFNIAAHLPAPEPKAVPEQSHG